MTTSVKAYAVFLPEIRQLLSAKDLATLKNVLREINPFDLAEGWRELTREEQRTLFRLLGVRKAVVVFEELAVEDQIYLLQSLGEEATGEMVNELEPGEVAHLFRKLPPRVIRRLRNLVKREGAVERLEQALSYPPHTVGAIMHTEAVRLRVGATASQALEQIRVASRTHAHAEGIVSVLYVVNGQGTLAGFVSLQTLVAAPGDSRVAELMSSAHSIQIRAGADQEEAARLVSKYNLLSAPVVDEQERLVGVLLIDDVVDILNKEASEDMAKMAGTVPEELTARNVLRIVRLRLPWLLASVLCGGVVSLVIRRFEATLLQVVALASFMPLIAAMGGNVGSQSAMLVVRGLTLGQLRIGEWSKAIAREFAVGLLLGLSYAVVVGGFAYGLYGVTFGAPFAMVVALGMLVSMTVAATMGAMGPFLFQRLGIDPATATGPLITTTTDLVATSSYLVLATIFLV